MWSFWFIFIDDLKHSKSFRFNLTRKQNRKSFFLLFANLLFKKNLTIDIVFYFIMENKWHRGDCRSTCLVLFCIIKLTVVWLKIDTIFIVMHKFSMFFFEKEYYIFFSKNRAYILCWSNSDISNLKFKSL